MFKEPYDLNQIKTMIDKDQLMKDGMEKWAKADVQEDLKPLFGSVPPPPPAE